MRLRVWAAGNMSANVTPPHFEALKLRPWLTGFFGVMMIPFFASIAYYLARTRAQAKRADDPTETVDTLSQLKGLHDSGDLSDAEYTRQRSRVLTPA